MANEAPLSPDEHRTRVLAIEARLGAHLAQCLARYLDMVNEHAAITAELRRETEDQEPRDLAWEKRSREITYDQVAREEDQIRKTFQAELQRYASTRAQTINANLRVHSLILRGAV
jgi:hypothetical protein